jgi:hypothetical protein
MVSEAAVELDVSAYLLRKWIGEPDRNYWPSQQVKFGRTFVYLYTPQDIERIRSLRSADGKTQEFTGKRSVGRPRKYSDVDRTRRGQLQSRRNYWRLKAEEAMFRDDQDGMDKAKEKITQITEELEGMN